MESESKHQLYQFLEQEASVRYFAEADFSLRKGRHLQDEEPDKRTFRYVDDYFDDLYNYYTNLFGVYLRKDFNDTDAYIYLEFPEENKGKFRYERSWEIKDKYLVFGILLINLYYEKYFEKKEIKWEEIEHIISEGEKKQLWQKLLFTEARPSQTPSEWQNVRRIIKNALDDFEELGWIKWIDKDEIIFEILPSIDRLNKLYKNEIELIALNSKTNSN